MSLRLRCAKGDDGKDRRVLYGNFACAHSESIELKMWRGGRSAQVMMMVVL